MFGLPLSTTLISFGIPILLMVGLIWWRMRFSPKEEENLKASEDAK